ncbi:MAG TPA: hypothetical protein VL172_05570 [Kofleriaceae bacterium]|jgi:hypothetical protein|nr:hypothetical protein [Kofleriaceae bacterium]
MAGMKLFLSLSGPQPLELLRAAVAAFLPSGPPSHLRSDSRNRKVGADWVDTWAASTEALLRARWGDDEVRSPWVSYNGRIVKIERHDAPRELAPVLERLGKLPFHIAVAGEIYPEWADAYLPGQRTGFADGHNMHGWMCAFKDEGHLGLVSRRWLEFGPWKLHRGAADTSLVQFHRLDADWKTALDQARPGHRRMGISDEGGYIQTGYQFSRDLKGDYFAADKRLRILIQDRDLTPLEMLDAAAMRLYQVLGKSQPIEAMAFMFTDEARARRHLHELWLRGLECWVFKDGRAQRLDDGHAPRPQPPAWA